MKRYYSFPTRHRLLTFCSSFTGENSRGFVRQGPGVPRKPPCNAMAQQHRAFYFCRRLHSCFKYTRQAHLSTPMVLLGFWSKCKGTVPHAELSEPGLSLFSRWLPLNLAGKPRVASEDRTWRAYLEHC